MIRLDSTVVTQALRHAQWQWHSTEFDGEDKVHTKLDIVHAGAADPRKLFNKKRKEVFSAMYVGSTSDPHYKANKGLREMVVQKLDREVWGEGKGDGFRLVKPGSVSHAEFFKILARAAYTMSPAGMASTQYFQINLSPTYREA